MDGDVPQEYRASMTTTRTAVGLVTMLALALVAAPVWAAEGWIGPTRVLASYKPFTPSVAVDAAGNFHIAWLQDAAFGDPDAGIFYATDRTGEWVKERVTTGDTFFARPSLSVTPAGDAYIAFARVHCPGCPTNDAVRIWTADNKTGQWRVKPRTDGFSDLAPSARFIDGKWHIAFQRFGSDIPEAGVWYLTNESGSWVETRVASAYRKCPVFQNPSLRLDDAGAVWMVYEAPSTTSGCGGTSGLRLATDASGSWVRSPMTANRNDYGPSLVLDMQGRPHVAFGRSGTGIYYTRRQGGTWFTPAFVSGGEDPSLAVSPTGNARLTFEENGVAYATNKSGSFVVTQLADYGGFGLDEGTAGGPVLAIDLENDAHVLYAKSAGDSEDDIGIFEAYRP